MSRKQKNNLPPGDEGRTIVNMNVEGMPWYRPEKKPAPGETTSGNGPSGQNRTEVRPEPMTRDESRYYTWGALKAALLVVGVMCGGIVLFVLFCQFIWFR